MPFRALTVATVAMLGLVAGSSTASAAAPVSQPPRMAVTAGATNYFKVKIHNPTTDMMLDIVGPSTQAGARLNQYNEYSTTSQLWDLWVFGDGYYEFVNEYSGMCMDVDGPSQSSGAAVHQWPCYGGDSQRWSRISWLVWVGSQLEAIPVIVNKYSGKCLDVVAYNRNPNALLQQWDCTGTFNQSFDILQW